MEYLVSICFKVMFTLSILIVHTSNMELLLLAYCALCVTATNSSMRGLKFADYVQRGVTFTLFSITMYGAFVVGDGAFDIINRRLIQKPADKPVDSEKN